MTAGVRFDISKDPLVTFKDSEEYKPYLEKEKEIADISKGVMASVRSSFSLATKMLSTYTYRVGQHNKGVLSDALTHLNTAFTGITLARTYGCSSSFNADSTRQNVIGHVIEVDVAEVDLTDKNEQDKILEEINKQINGFSRNGQKVSIKVFAETGNNAESSTKKSGYLIVEIWKRDKDLLPDVSKVLVEGGGSEQSEVNSDE
jgi:hypothetical protein